MEGGFALLLSIITTSTWGEDKRFLWLTAFEVGDILFFQVSVGARALDGVSQFTSGLWSRGRGKNGAGIIYTLQSHKSTNWRPCRKSHLLKTPSHARSVGAVLSLVYAVVLWGPFTLWTVEMVKLNVPSTDCLFLYPSSAKVHLENLRCLTSLCPNLRICQMGATTTNVSPSSVVKISYFMCIKSPKQKWSQGKQPWEGRFC